MEKEYIWLLVGGFIALMIFPLWLSIGLIVGVGFYLGYQNKDQKLQEENQQEQFQEDVKISQEDHDSDEQLKDYAEYKKFLEWKEKQEKKI